MSQKAKQLRYYTLVGPQGEVFTSCMSRVVQSSTEVEKTARRVGKSGPAGLVAAKRGV